MEISPFGICCLCVLCFTIERQEEEIIERQTSTFGLCLFVGFNNTSLILEHQNTQYPVKVDTEADFLYKCVFVMSLLM